MMISQNQMMVISFSNSQKLTISFSWQTNHKPHRAQPGTKRILFHFAQPGSNYPRAVAFVHYCFDA